MYTITIHYIDASISPVVYRASDYSTRERIIKIFELKHLKSRKQSISICTTIINLSVVEKITIDRDDLETIK